MKFPRLALALISAVATGAEKPNVLLILADDMGWSDAGCYGSEIETPNLDRLAAGGLRFTRFYNAARCCPSRASLLTGLYPHEAGIGAMVVNAPGEEKGPYQGYLNDRCTTLAEALEPAGYRSYLSGKWHVGEFRPVWPVDRGFARSYGLISGAMNYYDIRKAKSPGLRRVFARDGDRIEPPGEGFYATHAFTDAALRFLKEHREAHAGRPWLLYLAYTAPHWPLHAPEEVVRKYLDRYRGGWEPVREARHRRQVGLGLAAENRPLGAGDGGDWSALPENKRAEMVRKMAVYAAMVEVMDRDIGRMIGDLEKAGELENTLVVFLSDNGGSAEGGPLGQNFRPDLKGPVGAADSYHSYGRSWSNVSNTPLRRHKSHTHEGGIRTPCIIHWPAGLRTKPGATSDETAHVIDVMPTLLELAGSDHPRDKAELSGVSLLPVLRGKRLEPRKLGWEHFGSAAWRDGVWKLVREDGGAPWELYDLGADPCESEDLAARHPERVEEMAAAWAAWADRVGVRR